jgi:hypothetical protein
MLNIYDTNHECGPAGRAWGAGMTREYKTYAVTLDQETRDLLDALMERLSLPSRSAILRLAVRELAARHGLKAARTARRRKEG